MNRSPLQYVDDVKNWLFEPERPKRSPGAALHRTARILYATVRDLVDGQLTLHAMSLVYTTLLSIVPLLALSFSVLKAMGAHNHLTPLLMNFFEPFGEQGTEVVTNILSFVDNIKVGVLGFLGLGLLVYTVISLVQKIERSFNAIWRVPELRSIGQRFSNYLSVIMVGPLLVVSAIGATASIMNSSIVQQIVAIEPFGTLFIAFGKLAPYFFIVIAFTFVYGFMPNTRVHFTSALLGGLIGGVAWQTSGVLFASFVVKSSNYEAIYSGFAIGIVLLIWLYICWLILLLGATISYYYQNSRQICPALQIRSSARQDERVGLALMFQVAQRFDQGRHPQSVMDLEHDLGAPAEVTRRLMNKLIDRHFLAYTGDRADHLVPGKSIDQIPLVDLIQAIRQEERSSSPRHQTLDCDALINTLETEWANALEGQTLADLVRKNN